MLKINFRGSIQAYVLNMILKLRINYKVYSYGSYLKFQDVI